MERGDRFEHLEDVGGFLRAGVLGWGGDELVGFLTPCLSWSVR